MIADRVSRHRRRERKWLRGIWLVWVGLALHVDVGEAGRPFRTEDNVTVPLGSFELELGADLAFEGSDRGLLSPAVAEGWRDRPRGGRRRGRVSVRQTRGCG